MVDTDFQVQQESLAPPPLGQELISGKWRVNLIDAQGNITEKVVSGKQVWTMFNSRVMVDFNRRGHPIKDSGGLFGIWLGSLSNDVHLLPIAYTDWRKIAKYRKDMAWKVIRMKFWFDDPNKRKSYALSTLGSRCKDLKRRLWKEHRRNTIDESIKERPPLIPEDQWRHFVHLQFTEKAKKTRERNTRNRRLLKIPHALGKKSLARKSDEIEEETGREPTRGELFIASRKKSDGSFVSNEAKIIVEKVEEAMKHPETSNGDAISQVFGPEHPGRVRCIGRGPTPSKYFSNCGVEANIYQKFQVQTAEIGELKFQMEKYREKLNVVANAVQMLLSQGNGNGENKMESNVEQKSQMDKFEEKLDVVASALQMLIQSKGNTIRLKQEETSNEVNGQTTSGTAMDWN